MYIVACEYPLLNQSMVSSLNVLNYKEPAVVGTTVSFNCSQLGEELTGPDTAICMDSMMDNGYQTLKSRLVVKV